MYDPESAPALARVLASLLSSPARRRRRERHSEREGGEKPGGKPAAAAAAVAVLAGVVRSKQTAAAFERAFAGAGLSFSSSDEPPTRAAKGCVSGVSSPMSLRRVRVWHSGDEGVKVRWWMLRKG